MNTTETTILSGFWQKNGLGPLGVKGNFILHQIWFALWSRLVRWRTSSTDAYVATLL